MDIIKWITTIINNGGNMLVYGIVALIGFILVSAYTLVKTFLNKK